MLGLGPSLHSWEKPRLSADLGQHLGAGVLWRPSWEKGLPTCAELGLWDWEQEVAVQ